MACHIECERTNAFERTPDNKIKGISTALEYKFGTLVIVAPDQATLILALERFDCDEYNEADFQNVLVASVQEENPLDTPLSSA